MSNDTEHDAEVIMRHLVRKLDAAVGDIKAAVTEIRVSLAALSQRMAAIENTTEESRALTHRVQQLEVDIETIREARRADRRLIDVLWAAGGFIVGIAGLAIAYFR